MIMIKYLSYVTTTWLLTSWWLMLGIGIAHDNWWHQLPSMGYPTALLLGLLFGSMLTGGATTTYALAKGWLK